MKNYFYSYGYAHYIPQALGAGTIEFPDMQNTDGSVANFWPSSCAYFQVRST